VGAANRALERARIPWRFGAPARGDATVQSADSLLARGVTVRLRYPLVAVGGGGGDTLARIGREPWVVAGAGWVLVGSPLDPEATSLPVRAAFVPWLAQVLGQRLGGESTAPIAATPLARVVLPAGAEELEQLDGTLRPVRPESLSAPAAPGVYFVRRGARRVGALVVNVEPEETELRRLSGEEVARRLGAREVHARPDRFADALYASGARRPLAGAFLALALVALLLESLLAGGAPLARRGHAGAPRAAA
jgi:hypothetical protein